VIAKSLLRSVFDSAAMQWQTVRMNPTTFLTQQGVDFP
jgi:hypothetical protein